MELAHLINHYVCGTCGYVMVTRNADEGTTPFIIQCRRRMPPANKFCGGQAQSVLYDCPQKDQLPGWEWYKPTGDEYNRLGPAHRKHIDAGGLLLREITTDDPVIIKQVTAQITKIHTSILAHIDTRFIRDGKDSTEVLSKTINHLVTKLEQQYQLKILIHNTLDKIGVPSFKHQECRINKRLNWLIEEYNHNTPSAVQLTYKSGWDAAMNLIKGCTTEMSKHQPTPPPSPKGGTIRFEKDEIPEQSETSPKEFQPTSSMAGQKIKESLIAAEKQFDEWWQDVGEYMLQDLLQLPTGVEVQGFIRAAFIDGWLLNHD